MHLQKLNKYEQDKIEEDCTDQDDTKSSQLKLNDLSKKASETSMTQQQQSVKPK